MSITFPNQWVEKQVFLLLTVTIMFWLLLMLRKVYDYDERASVHLRISRQSVVSVVPVVVLVNVRLKAAVPGPCTQATAVVGTRLPSGT